jgi:hypothetical protein
MFEVDLNDPDPRIKHTILKACAEFGPVRSIKVHRNSAPFAVIEMSQRDQTCELAFRYGGSAFGTSALIHLTPKSA